MKIGNVGTIIIGGVNSGVYEFKPGRVPLTSVRDLKQVGPEDLMDKLGDIMEAGGEFRFKDADLTIDFGRPWEEFEINFSRPAVCELEEESRFTCYVPSRNGFTNGYTNISRRRK